VIAKAAAVLPSGGRMLFTAPREVCSWLDAMTEERSMSLGFDEYRNALEIDGMQLVGTQTDEGGSYYYSAMRP
jgi:hypothetical protein